MTHDKVAHRLAHADHAPPLGVGAQLTRLDTRVHRQPLEQVMEPIGVLSAGVG